MALRSLFRYPGRLFSLALLALLAGGCSGRTTGVSSERVEADGSYTVQLGAAGSCDTRCQAYMRWRPKVDGDVYQGEDPADGIVKSEREIWRYKTTTLETQTVPSDTPFTREATGLFPGPTYEYQVCGKEQGWDEAVCVGPDGRQDSTHEFTVGPRVSQGAERRDTDGELIDAHDGGIERFGNRYYLYGTSYECGFRWAVPMPPNTFCGFKAYSSSDLTTWRDEGLLYDPAIYGPGCTRGVGGCFRPHVLYNARTNKYVLWVYNSDRDHDFDVSTSNSPTGPFVDTQRPPSMGTNQGLAWNGTYPLGAFSANYIVHGDHNLFLDHDGQAYVIYTDWKRLGKLVVQRLNEEFTAPVESAATVAVPGAEGPGAPAAGWEAPAMFVRDSGGSKRYYLMIGNPACGYCSDTGTSYLWASNPMGPWAVDDTAGTPPPKFAPSRVISGASCGGQPTHVTKIGSTYLFQSDLWDNRKRNQKTADYFWAPLSFDSAGRIRPIDCSQPAPRIPLP